MARIVACIGVAVALLSAAIAAQAPQARRERVAVTGAVNKPGVYPIAGRMTPLTLIELAGGLLPSASDAIVIVSGTEKDANGNPTRRSVSLRDLRTASREQPQLELRPGDHVIVENR